MNSTADLSTPRQDWPSVNQLSFPLLQALIKDAQALRIGVEKLDNGCTIIDAGINALGGIEAGRRIAEICLGGLGQVKITSPSGFVHWPWHLCVSTTQPVLACLGSQYAGWHLSSGEGKKAFNALGSGPGRALAFKEELFKELNYRDKAESACLVLEVDKYPPSELIQKIAKDCGITANNLTLILTPTKSLAGTVQIVARILEVALHKAHALGFSLEKIIDGLGSAPLPPPAPDFLTAMGRTNDAILFGGQVQLFVRGNDDEAQSLASQLSCANSRDYGQLFSDIFKSYKFDFYHIDSHLFAPAEVIVTAVESGHTFRGGKVNERLLDKSFGLDESSDVK